MGRQMRDVDRPQLTFEDGWECLLTGKQRRVCVDVRTGKKDEESTETRSND